MLNFIKEKIKKIYSNFTEKVSSLFSKDKVDEPLLKELEILLISADTGITTTRKIIESLKKEIGHKIKSGIDLKEELKILLVKDLKQPDIHIPKILMLVGVNGTGKTTFAGKLANQLKQQNKKVLLVAGDTFRAAATEQLQEWGKKIKVDVFIGKTNQDPSSIIFDACNKFITEKFDHLIIDTAGRIQTKANLMRELEKMRKIINKQLPENEISTWLTIDSMLGQNSFQQAKVFNDATNLNGLVLTKMDGTGKGGIVFSIIQELKLPIIYITFGESLEDLKQFNPNEYVEDLLG